MRTTWKQRLAVYAGHVQAMYNDITSMPYDELKKLDAACKRASVSNCGWTTYRAAQFMLADVHNELHRRRQDRRASRRAEPQEAKHE